jgi:LuxR family maltose regulon positive regulatory protein
MMLDHAQQDVRTEADELWTDEALSSRPDWVIARPRLVRRLHQAVSGSLTVVTGPPGAGKTVAVASWALTDRRRPGPVVWIASDRSFGSISGFCTAMAGALWRAGLGLGPPTSPDAGEHDLLVGAAAYFEAMDTPVILVLDDFTQDHGSALADCVTYLLKHSGPGLRVVVICRGNPPLPLHRYRLAGDLTEIRADELAFTERETTAVLAQHAVHLTAATLENLMDRTEGWPAGVRLAAMSLAVDPGNFADDDGATVSYLIEEVIDVQPAAMRRVLLAVSAVDRFDADLAAELAGDEACGVFPEMVRQNAFIVPLGDGWYRWHQMFRRALHCVVRRESPGGLLELHRRAAAWLEVNGQLDDAVHQAVHAGDWQHACSMVVDGFAIGEVLELCASSSLGGLFARMPQQTVLTGSDPGPAIVAAAAALAQGDTETCVVALRHAEGLLDRLPDDQAIAARWCASFVAGDQSLDEGRFSGIQALGAAVPARSLDDRPELLALLASKQGVEALRKGDLEESELSFTTALAAAQRAGGDFQRRSCLGYLALVEALMGRFLRAAELAGRAAQLPEVSTLPPGRRVVVAHLVSAWVDLERGELKAARAQLERVGPALQARPDTLLSLVHCMISSRLEIAEDLPELALELIASMSAEAGQIPWLERRMMLLLSEAQTARGSAVEALAAAERSGGTQTPGSALALAKARMCGGEHEAATSALQRALAESGPPDVQIDAWLFDACLSYRREDLSRGRRSLDRALRLAKHEQIMLSFMMSRAWLGPVLRRDSELLQPYLRLLEPMRLAAGPDRAAVDAQSVGEQLSSRELDVLRLLALLMTTEEIASDLCLSVNTIKTHLRSIYRKLGVTRRGQAVRRAWTLGLLDAEARPV